MRRLRSYDRERERRLEAIDEAREDVLLARRDYYGALDELDELEGRDEEDERYEPPRRWRNERERPRP